MINNIYNFTLPKLDHESFKTLLNHKNVEIKTILSNTLKTEQTFHSNKDEWVIILQGCAKLELDGVIHKLKKGDNLFIPANKTHTLLKTKKLVVWLAVYIS